MWFVCISGVTSAFLKLPPPIDMLLVMVVPAEIGLLIAVLKCEFRAGVRCLSRKPVDNQCRILTISPASFWR